MLVVYIVDILYDMLLWRGSTLLWPSDWSCQSFWENRQKRSEI